MNNTYRIGIHAQRNAGKTCLFACLYGLRANLNDNVTFDDEPTLVYLRQAWAFIQNGHVPPATSMGRPAEMVFRVSGGGESFEIVSADYAGALIEPSEDETARELSEEARAWVRSCDAILVLGDSAAPEVAQLDAVELLLAEMSRDGGQPRPLALVLTKWDVHGEPSPDPAEEAERLEQYLVSRPVFGRLQKALKEAVGDPRQSFAVFPMSAFGMPGPSPGQSPPTARMKPHRLTEPWIWAARQCARLDEVRRRATRRRRLVSALATLVFAVVALAGGFRYADRRADQEFLALLAFRQESPADELAEECAQREEQFLGAWWSHAAPSRRAVVQSWRAEDAERAAAYAALVEVLRRARRHDELVAAIERDALAMTERGEERKAFEMCQTFLAEFDKSPKVANVLQVQATVRDRWDGRVWLDVRESRPKYVAEAKFQELAALVDEYIHVPQARNRREAERLLQDAEWEVDRRLYQLMLVRSRQGHGEKNLLEVNRLADDYLRVPRKRREMEGAVKYWKGWWDGITGPGASFRVHLQRISLPSDTGLSSFWGLRPVLVVTVGDRQTRSARTYRGREVTSDEVLSPIEFRWGDRGPLRLRVENGARTRLKAELEFPAGDFPLPALNGTHQLTDGERKTVTVVLTCPEAIPPNLPEYGAKE